jgi:hypothetical protein
MTQTMFEASMKKLSVIVTRCLEGCIEGVFTILFDFSLSFQIIHFVYGLLILLHHRCWKARRRLLGIRKGI